jgi:hypothetical protein
MEQRTRPSTRRGYRMMWKQLKPFCENLWIREVRTKQVQDVLDNLAALEGSREEDGKTRFNINSLKHLKSFFERRFSAGIAAGIFRRAQPCPRNFPAAGPLLRRHLCIQFAGDSGDDRNSTRASIFRDCDRRVYGGTPRRDSRHVGELPGRRHPDRPFCLERPCNRSQEQEEQGSYPHHQSLGFEAECLSSAARQSDHRAYVPNDAGKAMDLNNLLNRFILPALDSCAVYE